MEEKGSKYHQTTSDNNRYEYEQAKKELEEAYNTIAEEEQRYKISLIEVSHVNSQHSQAWKLVNEIHVSGRRTSQRREIKGDTKQERIDNWYKPFVGLLGSEPKAIDALRKKQPS